MAGGLSHGAQPRVSHRCNIPINTSRVIGFPPESWPEWLQEMI